MVLKLCLNIGSTWFPDIMTFLFFFWKNSNYKEDESIIIFLSEWTFSNHSIFTSIASTWYTSISGRTVIIWPVTSKALIQILFRSVTFQIIKPCIWVSVFKMTANIELEMAKKHKCCVSWLLHISREPKSVFSYMLISLSRPSFLVIRLKIWY